MLVDVRNPGRANDCARAAHENDATLFSAPESRDCESSICRVGRQSKRPRSPQHWLPLIRPNVVLDQTATAAARETEASRVQPVVISLKRNQVVAREGDTVTPSILAQIAAIKSAGHSGRPWHNFFGLLLVVIGVYWAAWKFAEHRSGGSPLSLSKHKAFALVGSAILVQTALMKVGFAFGESMAARMQPPFNDPVIWNFAIPFAAARTAGGDAGRYSTRFSDRNHHCAFCGHAGAGRNAESTLRDGLVFGGDLRNRTLSRAAVGHARGSARRRGKRGHGHRAHRVFRTATHLQNFSDGASERASREDC